MTDSDKIIQFFVEIFIRQSGGPDAVGWQGEYKRLPAGSSPDRTYELRIRRGGEIKTRRMSIRQIGVAVESKSTCYMVTYDDFLVIKIPPAPLYDFDQYLDLIAREKKISDRLNPAIVSLAPCLSAILAKIPGIETGPDTSREPMEEDFIDLLKDNPEYQRYLKIGGGFVFFMELARYAFFDGVLSQIHKEEDRVHDEIIKNSDAFDDPEAFERIYGSDHEDLFFKVNDLDKQFDKKLADLLCRSASSSGIADYERREWLFAALAGHMPEFDPDHPAASISRQIGEILSRVIKENSEIVKTYYALIRSGVRRKIFDQHRSSMEMLVIKILELMCCLEDLGIAIRDLKPENMLVAGQRDNDRLNLADPDAYELGLIDLETAVVFQQTADNRIPQPLLGGTPAYITPSHLFANPVLQSVFPEKVPDVFCLQDWFAIIGIIFSTITGRPLFEKTSRLASEIVRMKRRGGANNDPEPDILKNVSRTFWKTAEKEFNKMISVNRRRLEGLRLELPEAIADVFASVARNERSRLRDAVKFCANFQKWFPKQADRLIDASVDAIRAQRIRWEKNDPKLDAALNVSPVVREGIVSLFQHLELLKTRLADLDDDDCLTTSSVSVDRLLAFMFYRVKGVMDCSPSGNGC